VKVLLDHNLPRQLGPRLRGHLVFTAKQMGWDQLSNGQLIAAAEAREFDVLVTADKKMYAQQNHAERCLSLVVLGNNEMKNLEPRLSEVTEAIDKAVPGSYAMVPVPLPSKPKTGATSSKQQT
jgi:hypothetical protein